MGSILWFVWKFRHQRFKNQICLWAQESWSCILMADFGAFTHAWSVTEMQLFVSSLVFAKCCIYAGAFFTYSYSPLSAEDVFLKSVTWQQCSVACKKWCGKEELMQGLKACTGFKSQNHRIVYNTQELCGLEGERQDWLSEWVAGGSAGFYRCWVLERIVIQKNNSLSKK